MKIRKLLNPAWKKLSLSKIKKIYLNFLFTLYFSLSNYNPTYPTSRINLMPHLEIFINSLNVYNLIL